MNRPQLLQHFETLADTPEAVEKLRAFILDLAVRGRLVPQNNKDESAADLLKRIFDEKRNLTRDSIGKTIPVLLEPFTSNSCPFAIPKNWAWVRTKDVTTYVQRGKSPKYSIEKKIPVIAQKCIQWHGFELHKAQFIDPASLESYSEDRFVKEGDLLWNSTGLGTLGRIIVFKERYKDFYPRIVADSHVTVIRPSKFIISDYLFCWFAGPNVQSEINAKASGSAIQIMMASQVVTAQPNISLTNARDFPIPIPPLAEQQRIVAKVDELMRWCDALEARLTSAQTTATTLLDDTLHRILSV